MFSVRIMPSWNHDFFPGTSGIFSILNLFLKHGCKFCTNSSPDYICLNGNSKESTQQKIMLFHPCEFKFLHIEKWNATKVLGSSFWVETVEFWCTAHNFCVVDGHRGRRETRRCREKVNNLSHNALILTLLHYMLSHILLVYPGGQ